MKTVAMFQIGGSNNDAANFCVAAPELQKGGGGHKAYVTRYVLPFVKKHPDVRLIVDRPSGIIQGEPLPLDMYLHAKDEKPWLADDFVEAWAPVVKLVPECIAYLGAAQLTPSLKGLPEERWRPRMRACVQPYINAGMSVAYDTAGALWSHKPGTSGTEEFEMRRTVGWIMAQRALGHKVYVEPCQRKGETWCDGMPTIIDEPFYRKCYPKDTAPADWCKAPPFKGEVLRIVKPCEAWQRWETSSTWLPQMIAGIHGDGHTAVLGFESW